MKKIILLILFVLPLIFTSCKKDTSPIVNPLPGTTEEIKVPNYFRWKTTKDVQLTIKGSTNGMLQILSSKGTSYWKVFIEANQAAVVNITIPAYETGLQLKYQGQTVSLDLNSSKLNYAFQ